MGRSSAPGLWPATARYCSRRSASMNASPSRRSSASVRSAMCVRPLLVGSDTLGDVAAEMVGGHADLLKCIAITDRHGTVLCGLPVDRDTERCSNLVLPAVAPSDRTAIIVEDRECAPQVVRDLLGHL